jgi:hypothetical protein
MSDGPPAPTVPDGFVQCDECGDVVREEQALTKQTPDGEPDVNLCPPHQ